MENSLVKTNSQNNITKNNSKDFYDLSKQANITPMKSVGEIRKFGGGPLSDLVRTSGKAEAENFLKIHLFLINSFFGSQFTDTQMNICAQLLYSQYHFWTGYDWELFSQRLMCGYFGKLYGAFNPAQLMEAAEKYNDEWMDVSENDSIHKHNERGLIETQEIPEKVADVLQVFIDKQEEKKQIELEEMNARINLKFEENTERNKEFIRLKNLVSSGELAEDEMLVQWKEFITK